MPSFTWLRSLFGRKNKTFTHARKGKPSRRTRLTLELLEDRLAPAAGGLDLSFDGDGKLTTDLGSNFDMGNSVAMDGNGKIVVAGYSTASGTGDFALTRYNADGSLDTSFDTDGKAFIDFAGAWDLARCVAIDGNGKIVVGGVSDNRFAVARVNADGSLDTSFDSDGKVITNLVSGTDEEIRGVAIDGNGKIVVAGYARNGSDYDFALVRYNTNGSLDTSFDTDGITLTPIGSGFDAANGVAIDGYGRIVAAGYTSNGTTDNFAVVRYNANGSLDTSFDTDGVAITTFGTNGETAYSVAIDGNGKIVVAGFASVAGSGDFAMARFNADGSLDTSFDTDGKVTTAIGTGDEWIQSVVIDGNGRIVAAGRTSAGSHDDFAVVRYKADGSLDTSFDGDGKVTTDFGSTNDYANGVAIDGNGRIVAAGYTENAGIHDFAIARYEGGPEVITGALDTTFDTDGKVTTAIGTVADRGYSVAIDGNGKIVVAGHSYNGSDYDFGLVRYNANGSLDTSFDTDGKVTTDFGVGDDEAYSVAIDGNGKIVVAGYAWTGSSNDFAVVRYNADGSLDTTFDTDGKVTTALGTGQDLARGVAIDGNGKIVVAGYSWGSDYDFAVVRYNADGSLDTSFDTDGKLTTAIGPSHDIAFGMALDGSGKIVVVGVSNNGTKEGFAVVRYNADGGLDTSFDTDGKLTTDFGTFNDEGRGVAIDGNGKIVVAGRSDNGPNDDFAVARYNADGSLDATFGTGGKLTTAFGTGNDVAYSVAIDGNGKIVAAGYSWNGSTDDFAVVRYNADGNLDTSFDTDGMLTTAFGTGDDQANGVAIDGNGRIIVGGYGLNGPSDSFAVAVYSEVTNQAPTDIALSSSSVAENATTNTLVGNLSTTDPDTGDTFTYSMITSAGGRFKVVGNQVQVDNASLLDYETATSHNITVRSTDAGGLWFEKDFSITVTNANPSTPTDSNGTANSIAEGATTGSTVGVTAAATDPNGPAVVFNLTDDAGGRFAIDNSTGVVTVADGSLLDYETATSHNITVQASDGQGGTSSQAFTITVTNANEAPTDLILSNSSVAENEPNATAVGVFSTTDPDAANTFTYTLVTGTGDTDNASFTINGDTLKTAASFDYETQSSYSIRVHTTDQGGLWYENQFTITVTDLAEARTFTVFNTNDAGAGSLRQAIVDANTNLGDDTIVFDPSVAGQTISLSTVGYPSNGNSALRISSNITINGANTILTTTGGMRLFYINNGGSLTFDRLVIRDITGYSNWDGGAIRVQSGNLVVTNSAFVNNQAPGVNDSWGGAIAIKSSGTATIKNTTFSGNSAYSGGGAISNLGILTLSFCTITNNTADYTGNDDTNGGGIANIGGTVTIDDTIVAGNSDGSTSTNHPDVSGTFTSLGYNLIGAADGSTGFTSTGDQTGTVGALLDPQLGALANNGGGTLTHGLLVGSPALHTGSTTLATAAGLTTDQRGTGFVRTSGAGTDIGAFEVQIPSVTSLAFVVQPRNVRSGNTFQVVVHALDQQSQPSAFFNGPVTISIASGPVGGVLGGTLTVNVVNGMATFNGLSLNRTGNYTLRANGFNLIQNSSNIVVAAHHLVFSYVPARVYGGFYFQVVVRAVDVDGVLATNYQGPITLTEPNGSLVGRTTVNAVNGVATFRNVFFKRLGNFRLTARSGSTTEQAPTNPLGLPADSPLALTSRVIYVGFWYRPVAIR